LHAERLHLRERLPLADARRPAERRLLREEKLLVERLLEGRPPAGRRHLREEELLEGRLLEGESHLREEELLAGRLPEGRLHLREEELLEGERLPEGRLPQSAGRLHADAE